MLAGIALAGITVAALHRSLRNTDKTVPAEWATLAQLAQLPLSNNGAKMLARYAAASLATTFALILAAHPADVPPAPILGLGPYSPRTQLNEAVLFFALYSIATGIAFAAGQLRRPPAPVRAAAAALFAGAASSAAAEPGAPLLRAVAQLAGPTMAARLEPLPLYWAALWSAWAPARLRATAAAAVGSSVAFAVLYHVLGGSALFLALNALVETGPAHYVAVPPRRLPFSATVVAYAAAVTFVTWALWQAERAVAAARAGAPQRLVSARGWDALAAQVGSGDDAAWAGFMELFRLSADATIPISQRPTGTRRVLRKRLFNAVDKTPTPHAQIVAAAVARLQGAVERLETVGKSEKKRPVKAAAKGASEADAAAATVASLERVPSILLTSAQRRSLAESQEVVRAAFRRKAALAAAAGPKPAPEAAGVPDPTLWETLSAAVARSRVFAAATRPSLERALQARVLYDWPLVQIAVAGACQLTVLGADEDPFGLVAAQLPRLLQALSASAKRLARFEEAPPALLLESQQFGHLGLSRSGEPKRALSARAVAAQHLEGPRVFLERMHVFVSESFGSAVLDSVRPSQH